MIKYQNSESLLAQRGLHIPKGATIVTGPLKDQENVSNPYTYNMIMLLDYIDIAVALSKTALKANEDFCVFQENQKNDSKDLDKVARIQFAKMTEALANQYSEVKNEIITMLLSDTLKNLNGNIHI